MRLVNNPYHDVQHMQVEAAERKAEAQKIKEEEARKEKRQSSMMIDPTSRKPLVALCWSCR